MPESAWRVALEAKSVQAGYESLVKTHGAFPRVDTAEFVGRGSDATKVASASAREDVKAMIKDVGSWLLKEFDEKDQSSRIRALRGLVATRKWVLGEDGWCNVTVERMLSRFVTAILLDEMVMEDSPSKEILEMAAESAGIRKQEKVALLGALTRELGVRFEGGLSGKGDSDFLQGLLGTVDSGMKDALAGSTKGACAVCLDRLFEDVFRDPAGLTDQFEKASFAGAMVECCTSWWGETVTLILCEYCSAAGRIPKEESEFKARFMSAFPAGRGLPVSLFSDASCGSDDAWQVFTADRGLVKPRIKLLAETLGR